MNIIKPHHEIITPISKGGLEELLDIEYAGRTCYVSNPKILEDVTPEGATKAFVRNLIANGHESVLEHGTISVRFVCDRGVSHELVRHRIASFSQESTRYCNYSKDRFGNEITVIEPCFFNEVSEKTKNAVQNYIPRDVPAWYCGPMDEDPQRLLITPKDHQYFHWYQSCIKAEIGYFQMLDWGATPQEARAVLPNSLKTTVRMTTNYREWRHILKLRTAKDAHPQMRELMTPLLKELQDRIPVIFDDITA